VHEFDNGLTLLGEVMEPVASAAMTLALPAGASRDPAGSAGAAAVAANWLVRGAGGRDTRQLNEALDSLGCQHSEDAHSEHLYFSSAMLGRSLPEVVAIYADILRRPHLEEATFPACRDLIAQELEGLEDEPMRKCNVLIRERFYPQPLGRNPLGSAETLSAMTAAGLRKQLAGRLSPRGLLLAVAGKFDWDGLVGIVGEHLGDWSGPGPAAVEVTAAPGGAAHVTKPTAQVQIGLAYPAVTVAGESYYAGRVAQMVLSGGMSSRLFTEVREKRGLVYAVLARYHSLKDHAGMFVYAGTSPERAQETLDVTVAELRRLGEGIEAAEVDRAKIQLKSSVVMLGESTSARADALTGDWYHLRRLRSLAELSAAVDAVKVAEVVEYVRTWPAEKLTALTIGPEALDTAGLP